MHNTVSSDLKDQATGLRHLFASRPANPRLPVHALSCPDRPALTLPLLTQLGQDLAQRGHTAMWVDELRLSAREGWPLPTRVRFDLSKALHGHEPLAHAVTLVQNGLWYALAQHVSPSQPPAPALSDRLLNSGVGFDVLMVSAAAQGPASLLAYGRPVHHTLVMGCEPTSLKRALGWMLQAQQAGAAESWQILLAGRGARLHQATQWVQSTAATRLQAPVQLLGTLDMKLHAASLESAWTGHLELLELLLQRLLPDW